VNSTWLRGPQHGQGISIMIGSLPFQCAQA